MNTVFKIFNVPLLLLISVLPHKCEAQKNAVVRNLNKLLSTSESMKQYNSAIDLSMSGNAYQLMSLRSYLGANNAIIEKQKDDSVIEYQLTLIENIINTAKVSKEIKYNQSPFKDGFKTWISKAENTAFRQEVPLYESYSFFYITQFLYYTKMNGWRDISFNNQKRWNALLSFIENNIWTKWYERSLPVKGNHYWYFLRGRTHVGSHWAGVAMYLHGLTQNEGIKKQTKLLLDQYDRLLKRNLKMKARGYVWNATYDNVEGTYASKVSKDIVQDVSHGNHVVSYILAAYEYGNRNWRIEDIKRLSYTLKEFVYDRQNNLFRDNVDGSTDHNRPGWGNFVGDGWVKLAAYDDDVKEIFKRFEKTHKLRKYNQELQFKASLHKNEWGI